jgi:hypothetical protein
MMQANASSNTLGFGQNQSKNDNIVVKSDKQQKLRRLLPSVSELLKERSSLNI